MTRPTANPLALTAGAGKGASASSASATSRKSLGRMGLFPLLTALSEADMERDAEARAFSSATALALALAEARLKDILAEESDTLRPLLPWLYGIGDKSSSDVSMLVPLSGFRGGRAGAGAGGMQALVGRGGLQDPLSSANAVLDGSSADKAVRAMLAAEAEAADRLARSVRAAERAKQEAADAADAAAAAQQRARANAQLMRDVTVLVPAGAGPGTVLRVDGHTVTVPNGVNAGQTFTLRVVVGATAREHETKKAAAKAVQRDGVPDIDMRPVGGMPTVALGQAYIAAAAFHGPKEGYEFRQDGKDGPGYYFAPEATAADRRDVAAKAKVEADALAAEKAAKTFKKLQKDAADADAQRRAMEAKAADAKAHRQRTEADAQEARQEAARADAERRAANAAAAATAEQRAAADAEWDRKVQGQQAALKRRAGRQAEFLRRTVPDNVAINASRANVSVVSWDPPPCALSGATSISLYRVSVRAVKGSAAVVEECPGTQTRLEVSGLDSVAYRVTVTAKIPGVGWGKASPPSAPFAPRNPPSARQQADAMERQEVAVRGIEGHLAAGAKAVEAQHKALCEDVAAFHASRAAERKADVAAASEAAKQVATAEWCKPWTEGGALWKAEAFNGLFGDKFVGDTSLAGEGGDFEQSIKVMSYFTARLAETSGDGATFAEKWLPLWSPEDRKALAELSGLLKAAVDWTKRGGELMQVVVELRATLRGMKVGGLLCLPGGWSSFPGHACMYTLERTAADRFAFTVTNTGSGAEYHPASSGKGGTSGKLVRTSMCLHDLPLDRMTSPVNLFALLKIKAWGHVSHDVRALYGVILPHLCGGSPIAHTAKAPEELKGDYATPQAAGTCFLKAVMHCMDYVLKRKGMGRPKIKQFSCALRVAFLDVICAQLGNARPPSLHVGGETVVLDESNAQMVRIACRQTCRAAMKEHHAKPSRLGKDQLHDLYQLVGCSDATGRPCRGSILAKVARVESLAAEARAKAAAPVKLATACEAPRLEGFEFLSRRHWPDVSDKAGPIKKREQVAWPDLSTVAPEAELCVKLRRDDPNTTHGHRTTLMVLERSLYLFTLTESIAVGLGDETATVLSKYRLSAAIETLFASSLPLPDVRAAGGDGRIVLFTGCILALAAGGDDSACTRLALLRFACRDRVCKCPRSW